MTSARLMERRLPAGAFHQFAPLDAPPFMRRFFAHWRPDLGLIAESEIWPNMIVEAAARRAAGDGQCAHECAFVSRAGAAPKFIARAARTLRADSGPERDDAERLDALGAREVQVIGNLKYDAPAPPADRRELAELSGLISGRQIWIAASTHDGEERAAAKRTPTRQALSRRADADRAAPSRARRSDRGAAAS